MLKLFQLSFKNLKYEFLNLFDAVNLEYRYRLSITIHKFLGCAAILAAVHPLKIVFVFVFVVFVVLLFSQINFYNRSFGVET